MTKKNVIVEANNLEELTNGIKNLELRGFKLVDDGFNVAIYETENTRFHVYKNF